MLKMLKNYLAQCAQRSQKGQIIVFTAILLPLLIAAAGFTIDLGNMYIHKARLQNAADAAAIAGGWAYSTHNETVDSHTKANATAENLIAKNHPDINALERDYRARVAPNGNTVFRVQLTEEIPVYFLSFFGGIDNTTLVAADAVAQIVKSGEHRKSIFDNLFSFGDNGLHLTWANEQNGLYTSSTFDGNIRGTGDIGDYVSSYDLITYDTLQKYNITRTSKDWDSVQKADAEYQADPEHNAAVYNRPETDSSLELDSELDHIKELAQNGSILTNQNFNLRDFKNDNPVLYYDGRDAGNSNISINTFFTATSEEEAKNNPIYIIVDTDGGTHNLNLNVKVEDSKRDEFLSLSRPVIYVYTGKSQINLHFNSAIFKGIIYAPYAKVFANETGLDFSGSIVAKDIELTGRQARYSHVSILSDDGDGSAGNNVDVGLTSQDDLGTIDWGE